MAILMAATRLGGDWDLDRSNTHSEAPRILAYWIGSAMKGPGRGRLELQDSDQSAIESRRLILRWSHQCLGRCFPCCQKFGSLPSMFLALLLLIRLLL